MRGYAPRANRQVLYPYHIYCIIPYLYTVLYPIPLYVSMCTIVVFNMKVSIRYSSVVA
jgi:hypothetical protein